MYSKTDELAYWLPASLELETTLFNLAQFSGSWRTNESEGKRSCFHLVLNGHCWLHLPKLNRSLQLQKGDAVFFLRENSHYLSSSPDANFPAQRQAKNGNTSSINDSIPESVALAGGLFDFKSGLSILLMNPFPDYLIVRGDQTEQQAIKSLFELIMAEAIHSNESSSPLIAHLTNLLFLYAIRELATTREISEGLCSIIRSSEFDQLVAEVIKNDPEQWSKPS